MIHTSCSFEFLTSSTNFVVDSASPSAALRLFSAGPAAVGTAQWVLQSGGLQTNITGSGSGSGLGSGRASLGAGSLDTTSSWVVSRPFTSALERISTSSSDSELGSSRALTALHICWMTHCVNNDIKHYKIGVHNSMNGTFYFDNIWMIF